MVKVTANAYGQYIRSRPPAAPESIKRVKEIDQNAQQIGCHPMFGMCVCVCVVAVCCQLCCVGLFGLKFWFCNLICIAVHSLLLVYR